MIEEYTEIESKMTVRLNSSDDEGSTESSTCLNTYLK